MSRTHKSLKICLAVAAICSAAALNLPCAYAENIDWEKRLSTGNHEMAIGNYDKAVQLFSKQVDKHPESAAARTALGMAYKKMGKMAEAKASFRRATEVEPGYCDSYYELGAMLESDKDYKEAGSCFERYLQLSPASSKKATVEDRIRYCRQNI